MKFRKWIVSSLSVLLLLGMLAGALASCGEKTPTTEKNTTTTTSANEETVAEEENPLFFEKTDYDKELTALYYDASLYKRYFFTDAIEDTSDLISTALYERDNLLDAYLGVTIRSMSSGDLWSVEKNVETAAISDSDLYQIVLTHCWAGLTGMISKGYLKNLYEFDDINFGASYWNTQAIKDLEVKRKAYLALNDFMITNPAAVYYNKDLAKSYNIPDLYEIVRDGEWTVEKMMEIAAIVGHVDGNSNGIADKDDIYGFGSCDDWQFIGLAKSCDVQWLKEESGVKILDMSSTNSRYAKVYEFCEDICDADWSFLYDINDSDNKINISDGRFLFTLEYVQYAYTYRGSEVKFGLLPYPKFDAEQDGYRSFDMTGMLCVPRTIRDETIVGQTLECLAYFSQDTIRPAYYEKLLGTRLAESPDDAEMITDYIFANIIMDPVFNYEVKANEPLGVLVYTIPKMLRSKLNGTPIETIDTNWASNRKAAQIQVDNFLN